jgi:Transglycosylase/Domain of Unknown Function (DUF748)
VPELWDQVRTNLGQKAGRIGLAIGVLIVLVVTTIFWWLPALVEQRIAARLAPRGLTFSAESLGVGLGEVSARGIAVGLAEGGARPVFKAERLDVQVTMFGALRGVSMEGGTVELGAELIQRLRSKATPAAAPTSEASAEERALPELAATNLRVVLRDSAGALMTAAGVDVAVRENGFVAAAKKVTIGELPGEVVELEEGSLEGKLLGRRPQLSRAVVKHAALRWTTVPSAAGRGETLARLRKFRSAISGEEAVASQPAAKEPAGALWTDDARIEVAAAEVLDVAPSGQATPIVEQLRVEARAKGARTLQLTGAGKVRGDSAHAGGSVAWDFTVTPADLKLEGLLKLDNVALSLLAPVLPPLPFYELDRTRVYSDVQITGEGLAAASVKGDLQIVDLGFSSEGLAKYPVGPISFSARGEATWTPARRELSAVKGTMRTGAVNMSLSGSLAWPQGGAYKVDLVADMAKASCQDVLTAVPQGVLDELATLKLGGDITGKLTLQVDAENLDATKVDFDIKDKCKFLELPEVLDLKRFEKPFTHVALEPDGTVFEMETGPGTAAWTPIEQISPFMTQAVIAHEDGRFMGHHGFAEPEIANALARNLKAHAFKFGASTITMQLVKNVFLHRDKLLSRKVQEALIVWWLEQSWDKRRILELYLNVIEYGPAIYGIRDAAMHYFGTIPLNLTPAQCGFLATILPAPKSFHEHYEKKKLSESMKSRIGAFLKHMRSRERIDEDALQFGLEELKTWKFYDPTQPPPVPVPVRGTAQPLPFATTGTTATPAGMGFNPWGATFEESGSFP